jgi:hypothetical protein
MDRPLHAHSPSSLQNIYSSLLLLLPTLSAPFAGSPTPETQNDLQLVRNLLKQIQKGVCGDVEGHLLESELSEAYTPSSENPEAIRQALITESVVKLLFQGHYAFRKERWVLRNALVDHWPEFSLRSATPMLKAIHTRRLKAFMMGAIHLLSSHPSSAPSSPSTAVPYPPTPAPPSAATNAPLSKEDAALDEDVLLGLLNSRAIPEAQSLRGSSRVFVIRVAIALLTCARDDVADWVADKMAEWWRGKWKGDVEETLRKLLGEGAWEERVKALGAMWTRLPEDDRKVVFAFALPLLYEVSQPFRTSYAW